ncbi:hypothetical protein [Amnibacterium kyonggiense]
MRRAARLIGALSAALVLAACTGTPAPSRTPAAGPPSFPRVAGDVIARAEPVPGDWTMRVRVADAAAAYRRARDLLTRGGYRLTDDVPADDGGGGQACTTAWCVTFAALTPPGGAPVVDYEVFHSSGVVG